MAATAEGRRLTEAHRLEQQQVRNQFLAEFIALWALLDSERLDETGPGWVKAVVAAIALFRRRSAEVSTEYYWRFRAVEAPTSVERPRIAVPSGASRPETSPPPAGPLTGRPPRQANASPRPRRADGSRSERPRGQDVIPEPRRSPGVRFDVDERAFPRPDDDRRTRIEIPEIDWKPEDRKAVISLNILGPIGQKSRVKLGKPVKVARDASFVEASGAASRHVLNGGRQSLMRLITEDAVLQGYIRVTDSDPCYFCAMLASRGPVYRTPNRAGPNVRGPRNARAGEAFVGEGTAKVHDHCACTIEPVYSTDTVWPGRAQEFHNLWNDNIRGRYSGEEAVRAWRRLYEGLQREARRGQIA